MLEKELEAWIIRLISASVQSRTSSAVLGSSQQIQVTISKTIHTFYAALCLHLKGH